MSRRSTMARDALEALKGCGCDEEKGYKIPMPKDPKERAEYEAAIAKRKAAGGGKFVGDDPNLISQHPSPDVYTVDPLTAKGEKIEKALTAEYGAKKGEQVLYAGKNKGTFTGIDDERNQMNQLAPRDRRAAMARDVLKVIGK